MKKNKSKKPIRARRTTGKGKDSPTAAPNAPLLETVTHLAKSGRTPEEQRRIDTAYRRRVLDLPHHRMTMAVGRIGYADEGLRLTFAIGMPFDYHTEVQLSRADAESLIEQLRANLDDPRSENLIAGTKQSA